VKVSVHGKLLGIPASVPLHWGNDTKRSIRSSYVFSWFGIHAATERFTSAHCSRDAQVIRQHGFVAPSRYETAAQIMLGIEPGLPLIHF
jgi:hypothetical protein